MLVFAPHDHLFTLDRSMLESLQSRVKHLFVSNDEGFTGGGGLFG